MGIRVKGVSVRGDSVHEDSPSAISNGLAIWTWCPMFDTRTNGNRRRTGVARKATIGLVLGVIALAAVATAFAAGGSVARTPSNSHLQPARIPGDYVDFTCTNSVISISGTVFCNNQANKQWDMCDSNQCLASMSDSVFPGHFFSKWTASNDAFFGAGSGGSPCSASQSSTSNPVTLCMSVPYPGNVYNGFVTAVVT